MGALFLYPWSKKNDENQKVWKFGNHEGFA
jgi:hypothetical protein